MSVKPYCTVYLLYVQFTNYSLWNQRASSSGVGLSWTWRSTFPCIGRWETSRNESSVWWHQDQEVHGYTREEGSSANHAGIDRWRRKDPLSSMCDTTPKTVDQPENKDKHFQGSHYKSVKIRKLTLYNTRKWAQNDNTQGFGGKMCWKWMGLGVKIRTVE